MRPAYSTLLVLGLILLVMFLWQLRDRNDKAVYEAVNFCGTEYQVEQILINGVDIIKRIAEIATEERSEYGQTILNNKPAETVLETKLEPPFVILNEQPFSINLATGKIFIEGFDSTFFGYLVK